MIVILNVETITFEVKEKQNLDINKVRKIKKKLISKLTFGSRIPILLSYEVRQVSRL